jgi:heme/copper-type cytochrome/quinol oxidase subunit 2
MSRLVVIPALCALLTLCAAAYAAEPLTKHLTIKNRVFTETDLVVPANTKVELIVNNDDLIPAEFESSDLSREVVVPGHTSVVVYIGPLSPGKYNFFNDFNRAAQGWVMVNPPDKAAQTGNR